jgi:hypothetical protein
MRHHPAPFFLRDRLPCPAYVRLHRAPRGRTVAPPSQVSGSRTIPPGGCPLASGSRGRRRMALHLGWARRPRRCTGPPLRLGPCALEASSPRWPGEKREACCAPDGHPPARRHGAPRRGLAGGEARAPCWAAPPSTPAAHTRGPPGACAADPPPVYPARNRPDKRRPSHAGRRRRAV